MELLFSWVLILGAVGACLYYCLKPLVWSIVTVVVLSAVTYLKGFSAAASVVVWALWLLVMLFCWCRPIRLRCITKPIMSWFKKQQPMISTVEQAVLDAGGTWWERDFFSGSIDWKRLFDITITPLTDAEQSFLDVQVNTLCSKLDDWNICHRDKDLSQDAWDYIKQERFWGLCVDTKYGGLGFSPVAHSAIVTQIATRSVSAAYTVMVPNSLGPAELIHYFGSDEQKEHYLPRLASGEEIPCFALTGTDAGSDAANITDTGVICYGEHQGEEVLGVRLSWEKRYITLAPIATLIGLAFHLYDPDFLLGKIEDLGISLALIPSSHPGVSQGKRHSPMTLGFMNGPLSGEDVFIPLTWLLGDLKQPNQGWSMLIECLAIGRGISMPALSSAVVQQCHKITGAYAKVRQQFNRPIGEFEGVQEALAKIGGWSYLIQATRYFTTEAVAQNAKPAVASAISKYHLTELSRKALLCAMDIHSGHGLQIGPSNLLANVYNGQPISTVGEGANIMTRNLMIFGQGILRSHKFIRAEIEAAHHSNALFGLRAFDRLLVSHIGFLASQTLRGVIYGLTQGRFIKQPQKGLVGRYCQRVSRMSNALILISEVALTMHGKNLKIKEALSARLGDILSHLYLAISILKYYEDHQSGDEESVFMQWSLDYCLASAFDALEALVNNFSHRRLARLIKRVLFPWGRPFHHPSDALSHQIANSMQSSSALRERLTQLCYIGTSSQDPIARVENAFQSILQNQKHFDTVERAIKDKLISRQTTRTKTIEEALLKEVIDQETYAKLLETERLRNQAIAVDAFSADEFLQAFGRISTIDAAQAVTK